MAFQVGTIAVITTLIVVGMPLIFTIFDFEYDDNLFIRCQDFLGNLT